MSEFNLSDQEIKSLLKAEGTSAPSMDFNQSVLDKIKKAEAQKARPVSAPKWILIVLGILFISPSLYFVFAGKSALTDPEKLQEYLPSIDTGIGSKFILIATLALLITGLTLMIGVFGNRNAKKERVKKG